MLRKVDTDQLRIGMFVHRFEERWLDHPFWRTRFMIATREDLDAIRTAGVGHVFIDEERGLPLIADDGPGVTGGFGGTGHRRTPFAINRALSYDDEKPLAAALIRHAVKELRTLFGDAERGDGVSIDAFSALTHEVMTSLERNPHALIALTRLKRRDEYTYVHSLSVSALCISFARSLGESEQVAFELGVAGLLHDIGKMAIPDSVLNKEGALDASEMSTVRAHPEIGYRLLSQQSDMPKLVLDVCRYHHERIDGTGYPSKLSGDQLSRPVRIAAICDVYDALTSKRPYKTAWKPVDAITRMTEWVGHFDQDLLFQFMKVVEVYPPGMLVRLRSNRLGVTMPNGRRASRPLVRAFYSARDIEQLPYEDIVIGENLANDQIMGREYPLDWGMVGWPILSEEIMRGKDVTIAAGARAMRA